MAGPSTSYRRSSSHIRGGAAYRRPSSSSSATSSSSSSSRLIPRSSPSSVSSFPRPATPTSSFPVSADESALEASPRSGAGDSISVTIRFRPLNEREFQRGDEIAWYADGDNLVRSEYNPATAYSFDRVFGPSTTSQVVYDVAARPVVKAAMEGINGTVFAYGVTSSGKTHTMHGDHNSPGVIPLAIKDVFSIIQDTPGREFLLRVSYLEIYNEVINDLLDPTGQNLRVRENVQGTYVEGIKEEVVLSPGHALSFIAAGEEHRHVGSNNFNLFSSRSHTIFTLMIESSVCGDEYDGVMYSQLNLIDLAGSESSKTETSGLRRKEGSYINKSLLTLGTVIGKLSEGKASHVPYRDSKLTRLLQSSLSGHGHVSLICTVTPASNNTEETHNTLKFASRAKRVEIYASCNRIIDEKSLIKKYQKEISSLKEELDQLKKGIVPGMNQEEIMVLRQQLEEDQVRMQSRLVEEEDAKAALMSRIQRLTKLILVSTKNTVPGCLSDFPTQQRRHSLGVDDKLENQNGGSPLLSENGSSLKNSGSSALLDPLYDVKHGRPSRNFNEEHSLACSSVTESAQMGKHMGGTGSHNSLSMAEPMMSDQMDLLVEQVKILAGEIAFGTSTLKRLVGQSVNDPEGSQNQVQNLEREINEKRRQMRVLEQKINENSEASMPNLSLVGVQHTVMKLMTQCSEKGFELEIKSADNRILQEQLQAKCSEHKALQEKVILLQHQLDSVKTNSSVFPPEQNYSEEIAELKRNNQFQETENSKLCNERLKLIEENNGLFNQNRRLADESFYAKELASAAAVELKNLAEEVTKLSLQNARQAKELSTAQDLAHSRTNVGNIRKHSESRNEGNKLGRKRHPASRGGDVGSVVYNDVDSWNPDLDDMKMELQVRKQREAALEAALAEKELLEDEYKRKFIEAKKREATLENDLAGMWVLVAKLKKVSGISQSNIDGCSSDGGDYLKNKQENDYGEIFFRETQLSDEKMKSISGQLDRSSDMEPMLVRLKARIQEMKEKEVDSLVNGDTNTHVCKVCFESPTSAVLLPCRHFCLCNPCSLACSECPLCRTKIADRVFTFTS